MSCPHCEDLLTRLVRVESRLCALMKYLGADMHGRPLDPPPIAPPPAPPARPQPVSTY